MPAPQTTHVDPVLTGISVEYTNAEYVAKKLFPVATVAAPAGRYVKYSKKNKFKVGKYIVTANSQVPQVDWVSSFDNYSVEYHGVKKPISEIANQWAASGAGQVQSLEVYTTKFLKNLLLLEYESAVATLATTTASYGSNHDSPSTSWNESGATVIADVKDAIASCAKRPNTMVIGRQVYDQITEDSNILARIQYSERGIITPDLLGALFDIPNVFVASAQEEVGGDYLWGDNVVLAYVEPNIGPEILTFGLTFSPDGEDFIRSYRDETIGRGAQVIESHWAYDVVVVAREAGYLLNGLMAEGS